ncbi:hypothetical protein M501DRAFT_938662 [Patellaria atrata CBS 101060]|uniref:BHLH domain-containing protein n=1 Tax=Patellaria atrata CBS 101060 TaxID=1346257 RepID=A0A9P4VPM6_9PEZI|nr:hypothetical protein M501DRAFT_938662 [Patellaria atrata CBS 101060]
MATHNNVGVSNKRKRESVDNAGGRPAPNTSNSNLDFSALTQHNNDHSLHQNGTSTLGNASDTAAAALSHYSMTVPQSTELSFQSQTSSGDNERPLSASFSMGDHNLQHSPHLTDFSSLDALKAGTQQSGADSSQNPPASKPAVGSDEWHKVRRDNHKEVERRRRETINEGINELAKIVPGCEKNKGSILQRAVSFINQLKENESQNIEKWTLEKLLTEQAIAELSASCDKFKLECQRAWREVEIYKKALADRGVDVEELKNSQQNGDAAES